MYFVTGVSQRYLLSESSCICDLLWWFLPAYFSVCFFTCVRRMNLVNRSLLLQSQFWIAYRRKGRGAIPAIRRLVNPIGNTGIYIVLHGCAYESEWAERLTDVIYFDLIFRIFVDVSRRGVSIFNMCAKTYGFYTHESRRQQHVIVRFLPWWFFQCHELIVWLVS